MNFLLGIFTGFSIVYLWGYYLLERKKKEEERQTREDIRYYIDLLWGLSGAPLTLEQQLNNAIAREDFNEAARLRDLMNKK